MLVDTGVLGFLHLPFVDVSIRVSDDTGPVHVRPVMALDKWNHLRTELLDADGHGSLEVGVRASCEES